MTDLDRLQPGDIIRHRQFPEHAARVLGVSHRVEAVMVEHPDANWNHCDVSLDRGDVENLWDKDPSPETSV